MILQPRLHSAGGKSAVMQVRLQFTLQVTLHSSPEPSQHVQLWKTEAFFNRDMAMPQPVEQCDCKWIASLSDLQLMVHSLQGVEALAVDVEHHHLHSYLGFVCLLQLSTGKLSPCTVKQTSCSHMA